MRKCLLVVLFVAGCHNNEGEVIHPDCVAFADHLEAIAKGEIERMPEDKRESARARFEAASPAARTRTIEGCREHGTGHDRKGFYRCAMAATTRAELAACS